MGATPRPPALSSATGLLAMLQESQADIKAYALKKLEVTVGDFWSEIAEALPDIESLYEDEEFKDRELAALVASKVYYHLGELDDALSFALGAGSLFDVTSQTDYVQTLLAKCIDEYCSLCVKKAEQGSSGLAAMSDEPEPEEEEVEIDHRLQAIVERLFATCFQKCNFQQALGIAIECRRLDMVRKAITLCDTTPGHSEVEKSSIAMLSYCFEVCQSSITSRAFRCEVLQVLVEIYRSAADTDYPGMCQCLSHLNDFQSVAETMKKLIDGTEDDILMAYQVAFDLVENGTQAFLASVLKATTGDLVTVTR